MSFVAVIFNMFFEGFLVGILGFRIVCLVVVRMLVIVIGFVSILLAILFVIITCLIFQFMILIVSFELLNLKSTHFYAPIWLPFNQNAPI